MPQPRAVQQAPQPDLTTTAQEAGSDADVAELDVFEVVEARSPLESAPVVPDNERKSSCAGEASQSKTDTITASDPPAPTPTARPQSSSFRTPTVPRPEGYSTPPRGPSFSPITPPGQLAIENSDTGQDISSLELPAPVAAAHLLESTSALLSSSVRASSAPHPEGSKTPPQGPPSSPIAPLVQPSVENNDAGGDFSPLGEAVFAVNDEPLVPHATSDHHAIESDNEELIR